MKAILIVLILICMEAACVTAGNKTGIIESDVEGGRLCLWCGIAKLWYYKIGDQRGGTTGENQAAYADKTWLGRQFMEAHPGDWCAFLLKINEENVITIDDSTVIEIALADGSAARSDEILAMDGPNETRIWPASASILYLDGNMKASTYGRSAKRGPFFGAYPLYVRFPDGSCLAEDADGPERYFKAKPVGISIHGSRVTSRR